MSISSALSSAISGLNASSLQAQVISNNLANALTPGYAPRRASVVALSDGAGTGVIVTGITRDLDIDLLNDRRRADSSVAYSTTKSAFFTDLERVLGTPEEAHSLTTKLARFEASLVSASVRPEEDSRLQAAVLHASDITSALNEASDRIQHLRSQADIQIEQDVKDTSTFLSQIQTLSSQIVNARNRGNPANSFEDQRQLILDQLAEIVPLRVVHRGNGEVAIYTPGGATLLDGTVSELQFSASQILSANMTVDNGLLASLQIGNNDVATSGSTSPIGGGRLAANFELRDHLAVNAQVQLDAVARNLVERFQQSDLDPTRTAGDAGLFTDQGTTFDPANEIGISGRVAVSTAVQPENGGSHWRLRDGLNAIVPGPTGRAPLLQDLTTALTDTNGLLSGNLGATARSASGHIAAMMGDFGQQRLSIDRTVSFARANQAGLVETELSLGVNSDDELQRLLLVEQAYSANARLIQTADEMINTLLRI